MVLNFLKIEEDLNYNIHNIEFQKTKTVFSTTILKKKEYKITCIDRLYLDIWDFLDRRVAAQYENHGNLFKVNENIIKFYHPDYTENYADFDLFHVDCYLVSHSQLDYNKDFFNEEFFKKREDCPYEIHIIEIATIKQEAYEDESEDEPEEELEEEIEEGKEPIELKQTIMCDKCVICLENKANILYPKCLHISTCKRCEELHPIFKCPICREKVMIKYII